MIEFRFCPDIASLFNGSIMKLLTAL
jgi:hypothetical protein